MDYVTFLTGYDSSFIEPALPESSQPIMYTFSLKPGADLNTRVIKSKNACVEIPEFDIRILPGVNSKDLICDISGLLSRIEGAIKVGNNIEVKKREELLLKMLELKEGRRKATLIIIDPSGLSLIMGGAEKEVLNT